MVDSFDDFDSQHETVPGLPVDAPVAEHSDLQLTRIGHYVLLHRVGEGGMGVVYAAYDETLDRKVAIKLLRSAAHSQPRLLREAQAMARLSHQNVVQVYEIGEFEGAPFIVMEFVDGQTLSAWLSFAPRSQAEILAVFEAAGRGLVAAHAKGLVHRDFKPDNVMVSGDQRVLVMDFGLARGQGSGLAASFGELEHSPDAVPTELTVTGAIMGTPAYMAPEQYRGTKTGAGADQFSFCVALWEALAGERPFSGASLLALVDAVSCGRFREDAPRELPGWLRKVLERGLAVEPEARWPSMAELLTALGDDPTRRRRVIGGTLTALAVLIGGASWGFAFVEDRQASARLAERAAAVSTCERESQVLAEAWSDETRARLAQTFSATELSFAGDAWARTEARLGDYVRQWSRLREQVCLEVEVDHSRELRSAARERSCLDERQAVFVALLDAWSEVDRDMVRRAPAAAAELPLVSMCTNDNWLAHQIPAPEDEATRAAVLELRARLERVAALQLAADYAGALGEAEAVLGEAELLGWMPVEVEARLALGDLQERRGEFEGARDQLRRAFFDAGDVGHDLVALQAASKLSWTVGVRAFDHEQGLLWGELGAMFVERMGLEGTIHQARLLNAIGAVRFRQGGENEAALATYRLALVIRVAALGPKHPLVAATLNNIGLVEMSRGSYDAALKSLRESQAIRVATLGPAHPDVAASLNNIALVLSKQDDHEQALAVFEEAQPILEAALGSSHPALGSSLSNMGLIQEKLELHEDSFESQRRGLEIKRATLDADHALIAVSLTNLGEAQRLLGRPEDARESLEAAFAVGDQAARLPAQRAKNAFSLAQVLGERPGDRERARELAFDAARDYRAAGESEREQLETVEAWLREHP